MRFIELSGIETVVNYTINIDHIVSVRPTQGSGGSMVLLSNGIEMSVSDVYRDVQALICSEVQS
jgi:nitrogen fixation protein